MDSSVTDVRLHRLMDVAGMIDITSEINQPLLAVSRIINASCALHITSDASDAILSRTINCKNECVITTETSDVNMFRGIKAAARSNITSAASSPHLSYDGNINNGGGGASGQYYIPNQINDQPTQRKKRWARLTFEYNDSMYRNLKYVNEGVTVKSNNIDLEIVENKPSMKIIL
jgi:hypothetical protein